MTDEDFKNCEFIYNNMDYINYFDFFENRFAIRELYNNLDKRAKRMYKWYVYANIHMNIDYKNAIWNFLNSYELQYETELLMRKAKYKII